jgi:tRNA modification GTPase
MAYATNCQTIFAQASGFGKAAVAVIRISGPSTGKVIDSLVGRRPEPRVASYCTLREPGCDHILDRAIVLWFPRPFSLTGEDSAELQIHGAISVVRAISKVLTKMDDLRLAEPGEFARRSLDNGKSSLIQIEALGDLLNSETEQQRLFAIEQSSGKLQGVAEGWRRLLIEALVSIEAELDFSDEADVDGAVQAKWRDCCRVILADMSQLSRDSRQTECLRHGLTVLIAGPPNSGKSSLLNAISRRDVAIVSERAGTTRDLIEVKLDLGGFPVNLVDTAGIHATDDPIEREGIERARRKGAQSDLVLWLTPIDAEFVSPPGEFSQRPLWHILTKADSGLEKGPLNLSQTVPQRVATFAAISGSAAMVSAKSGYGIEQFIQELQDYANEKMSVEGSVCLANDRQRASITAAEAALESALKCSAPLEVVADDLRRACFLLEQLIGKVGVEDVLDHLFAQFCIGK